MLSQTVYHPELLIHNLLNHFNLTHNYKLKSPKPMKNQMKRLYTSFSSLSYYLFIKISQNQLLFLSGYGGNKD